MIDYFQVKMSQSQRRSDRAAPTTRRRHACQKKQRGRPSKLYRMKIVALGDSGATKRPESWKVMKELLVTGLGMLRGCHKRR